ncbi:subtilisin-like protease [Massariosphaeria phaeospora]|uniref:Subtilisin-like protease n=1 Tax=Massariosphaeria phaeospora TaxID=100035 RepID=A0A7C8I474_9PLEO|nr:subtilisin-like protease [Massariosphaeria phaeospora]
MPSLKNLVWSLSLATAVLAVPQIDRVQTANTIPGRWIARIEDNELLDAVLSTVLEVAGIEPHSRYSVGKVKGFNFEADDAILDILQGMGAIKSVEPDSKMYATAPLRQSRQASNATAVTQKNAPWGLSRLSHKKTGASDYIYDSSAGKGSFIYIIDTGIFTDHSEFAGRATIGKSFIDGAVGEDDQGHGTHCAGTAAGSTYGVAKAANLIAVKVLGADGSGTNSGVLKGIEWAVDHATENGHLDHAVLSMSLGGTFSQTTNDAIEEAISAGAFIAVAAGNDNKNVAGYSPGSAPSACTVGATTKADVRADFSNFGTLVDVFAPGKEITSAWIGGPDETNTIDGTSMACPHVAGLAAYLIGLEGPKAPKELCKRIQALALKDVLKNAGSGSPNLLVNNGNVA